MVVATNKETKRFLILFHSSISSCRSWAVKKRSGSRGKGKEEVRGGRKAKAERKDSDPLSLFNFTLQLAGSDEGGWGGWMMTTGEAERRRNSSCCVTRELSALHCCPCPLSSHLFLVSLSCLFLFPPLVSVSWDCRACASLYDARFRSILAFLSSFIPFSSLLSLRSCLLYFPLRLLVMILLLFPLF